jgi:peptidoglycan/LPS O-acetylase OafA/YrhL
LPRYDWAGARLVTSTLARKTRRGRKNGSTRKSSAKASAKTGKSPTSRPSTDRTAIAATAAADRVQVDFVKRTDRPAGAERAARPDRLAHPERTAQPERTTQSERTAQPERTAQSDRTARPVRLPSRATATGRRQQPRLRGLDGLRAIAIAAVVVFHLDGAALPGGFLGVDMFFAISGFLITRMLLQELESTNAIRLGRFYWRRARRLLPAVAALLAAVVVGSTTVWRDQLPTLTGGVLSSLTYVTNWWLIFDHQSYFVASGRPSMLQHLWSLAVEEQFYLVWSAGLVALVWLCRRRVTLGGVARVPIHAANIAFLLALGSTAVMAVFAVRTDLPYGASTSRVYFGSDTHSAALFLGAAAGAWVVARQGRPQPRTPRWARTLIGDLIGLAALVALCAQFATRSEWDPSLYRGGFLLFGALSVVAALCVSRPASVLGRLLNLRPLRWIGLRSYSIYLWHWPVVVVTRPGLDVHGPTLVVNLARAGVIVGLAALTYRFIEVPLRAGGSLRLRRAARGAASAGEPTRARLRGMLRPSFGALLVGATSVVAAAALALSAGPLHGVLGEDPPVAGTRALAIAPDGTRTGAGAGAAPRAGTTAPSSPPAAPAASTGPAAQPAAPTTAAPAAPPPPPPPPQISAFGDSVILGAGPALQARSAQFSIDAVEGIQAYKVLDSVEADVSSGSLLSCVVIHVGDNGVISPDQLTDTLQAIGPGHRIVVMNDRVPRDWQDANNSTLASVVPQFGNATLVDWLSLSAGQSGWLYGDGLHLTPAGADAYAQIVVNACG